MALQHMTETAHKPATLAEDALLHGVYVESESDLSSMKYKEFAKWIRAYGIVASVHNRLSIRGIHYALSHGSLVMVSVNPNIRGYDTAPQDQKGGHLVLVTGYDLGKGKITLNNPSGFTSTDTQIAHTLSLKDFQKYYARRGIVLSC
jgi:hypothetical protein